MPDRQDIEWIGSVLEDLHRFLQLSDQDQLASDIQTVLDRHFDRLRITVHDAPRCAFEADMDLPANAVPFPRQRQRRQ